MQDIAGLRIMVQSVDDVEEILEVLRQRQDMCVVQERDYFATRNHGYWALMLCGGSIQSTPLMKIRNNL